MIARGNCTPKICARPRMRSVRDGFFACNRSRTIDANAEDETTTRLDVVANINESPAVLIINYTFFQHARRFLKIR